MTIACKHNSRPPVKVLPKQVVNRHTFSGTACNHWASNDTCSNQAPLLQVAGATVDAFLGQLGQSLPLGVSAPAAPQPPDRSQPLEAACGGCAIEPAVAAGLQAQFLPPVQVLPLPEVQLLPLPHVQFLRPPHVPLLHHPHWPGALAWAALALQQVQP